MPASETVTLPSFTAAPLPDISALVPLRVTAVEVLLSKSVLVSSSVTATLTVEATGDIEPALESVLRDDVFSTIFSFFFSEQPDSIMEPARAVQRTAVIIHRNMTLLYLLIITTPILFTETRGATAKVLLLTTFSPFWK